MPVERSTGHSGKALIVAAVAILVALGAAFGIAVLDTRGTVDVRPGADEQRLADAESMADEIAEDGPAPFDDLAGHDRPIYLQYVGEDEEESWLEADNWLVFAARPPGAPDDCVLAWQEDEQQFRLLDDGEVTEECDGEEYPADGGDLPNYEVTIRDGTLFFDPRSDERASS